MPVTVEFINGESTKYIRATSFKFNETNGFIYLYEDENMIGVVAPGWKDVVEDAVEDANG